MKKELFICIIIIATIIIGDICVKRHTNNILDGISELLIDLKENLGDDAMEDIQKIKNIDSKWELEFKMLTCYLEHNELEKVKTQIVVIESSINADDKKTAYEEIDRAIYIIKHIETKQGLELDNIL